MAGFSTQQGDDRLTRQYAKEAYEASRRCGNQAVEAKALSLIAMAAEFKLESIQPVNQNIEEAVRLARSLDDKSVLAMVLFRAGVIYNALGDLVRCVSVQVEQVDLHHKLGDRALEAVGMGNLAITYFRLGLYKQARSILERARLINESLGAHRGIAYNLILLGELSWKSGDLRNAHRLLEQAQQEILPSQDTYGKVNIYFDLGMILLEMRDVAGALRRLNEAHELAISFELLPQICMTASALASCAVMQGDLQAASLHIHKAWDHLQEFGLLGLDNPVYIYRLCAEVFDALGEEENLQQVLEMGHSLIMDTADRIDVPEWRQSFLYDEPDNRAFLDLWERRKK
jgi:tetratricopeptide (TPR) repeat protein